jgi:hypothetical protein
MTAVDLLEEPLTAGIRYQWRRRRHYVESDQIRPVPGSAMEPYDAFNPSRGGTREPKPFYLALAALDASNLREVEEFVSEWGPLGLFFDPLIQVQHQVVGEDGQPLTPQKDGYRAVTRGRYELDLDLSSPWFAFLLETPLRSTATTVVGSTEEAVPLVSYCAPFLPDLVGPGASPSQETDARLVRVLHTESIWHHLTEPVDKFRKAVELFQDVCRYAAAAGAGTAEKEEVWFLCSEIEQHTRRVTWHSAPKVTAGRAGWGVAMGIKWEFPSLLSVAYVQLFRDLLRERSVRLCANEPCRHPFVTDRRDQRYCCLSCGAAQEQRERRREKKLDRERLAAAATEAQD